MTNHYLTLVERFVAVAEEGSVQQGAKRLNLSQPSVTQSIKRVEELFECELFERTKRGVLLTATGKILLRRSKMILEHGNLAREEISDLVAGRTGSLRIAAGTAWGTRYLPPIVRELHDIFPDIKVEVDINLTPIGLDRLYRGEVDIVVGGISGEVTPHTGFTKETLVKQRYAVGCGQNAKISSAKNVSMQELAQLPFVLYHEDELLMSSVVNEIQRTENVSFKQAVITRSVLVALEMAIEGPYALFLTESMFKRFEFSGIKIVDLDRTLPEFDTAVFYRDSLKQTEPFKKVLSALRQLSAT